MKVTIADHALNVHPSKMTLAQLQLARFKNGWAVVHLKDCNATAYHKIRDNGAKIWMMVYEGYALKPVINYVVRGMDAVAAELKAYAISRKASLKAKADRKAERNKPHTLAVGDILVSSWGYDQTNVDYYQVVRATDRAVWVRPIAGKSTTDQMMGDRGQCVPAPDQFKGDERKHIVGIGNRIRITSYSGASPVAFDLVDGVKKYHANYWSSYA